MSKEQGQFKFYRQKEAGQTEKVPHWSDENPTENFAFYGCQMFGLHCRTRRVMCFFLLRLLLGDSYDSQERTLERTKDLSVTFVIPAAASRHKTIAKSATMLQKHAFFI